MRLIGNKTRLLGEIEALLRERGIGRGTFLDIFSGSGSVSRHFKRLGYRVIANDRLSACFTQAVAGVEVSRYPVFEKLRKRYRKVFSSKRFLGSRQYAQGAQRGLAGGVEGRRPSASASDPEHLQDVIHFLDRYVEQREGLIFRNYSPGGPAGRMYFTEENARRIDGILHVLRDNHRKGNLSRGELHVLLAALLDAADRVANISGTYGAYLKKWQNSALDPVRVVVPEVLESPLRHQAFQRDANELVREVRCDVLYIDPPYTVRQYPANYHVPEIIAEYHAVDDLPGYEASLYGKTGLRPYGELKSLYCVRPSARSQQGNVLTAMTDLILSSHARHVVVSYNEEGLLTRDEFGTILSRFSGTRRFNFDRDMKSIIHKRFRSDGDRSADHDLGVRRYKVLDGKGRDRVSEWLFYAASRGHRQGGRRRAARRSLQETP